MWGETWQDELLVVLLLSRCTRSLHDGRAIKMSGSDWIVNFILYCGQVATCHCMQADCSWGFNSLLWTASTGLRVFGSHSGRIQHPRTSRVVPGAAGCVPRWLEGRRSCRGRAASVWCNSGQSQDLPCSRLHEATAPVVPGPPDVPCLGEGREEDE